MSQDSAAASQAAWLWWVFDRARIWKSHAKLARSETADLARGGSPPNRRTQSETHARRVPVDGPGGGRSHRRRYLCDGGAGCALRWTGADVVLRLRSEEHTSELQSLRHLVC